MLLSLYSLVWPSLSVGTDGAGASEYDYKRYRKYLLDMQKAAEKRDERLYRNTVAKASKKMEEAPKQVIERVAEVVVPSMSIDNIDFHKTAVDLQRVIAYLDDRIKFLMLERQQDQFEEEFLLLSIV